MTNHSIQITSNSKIYTATCAPNLQQKVKIYIDAVDEVFSLIKSSFGIEPQITRFHVEFIPDGGYYAGSGRIALSDNEPNLDRGRPACYDGGLIFETIHGFLEPLRHPPYGIEKRSIGKNRLDESFSTIIEIDFLIRVGANDAAGRHKRGEGMGRPHHPLLLALVDIYDIHGIKPFHNFFRHVDDLGKSGFLALDSKEHGEDEKASYAESYMKRLGEILNESANINVTEILTKRATP